MQPIWRRRPQWLIDNFFGFYRYLLVKIQFVEEIQRTDDTCLVHRRRSHDTKPFCTFEVCFGSFIIRSIGENKRQEMGTSYPSQRGKRIEAYRQSIGAYLRWSMNFDEFSLKRSVSGSHWISNRRRWGQCTAQASKIWSIWMRRDICRNQLCDVPMINTLGKGNKKICQSKHLSGKRGTQSTSSDAEIESNRSRIVRWFHCDRCNSTPQAVAWRQAKRSRDDGPPPNADWQCCSDPAHGIHLVFHDQSINSRPNEEHLLFLFNAGDRRGYLICETVAERHC